MNKVIRLYTPLIVKDHYLRWIFEDNNIFQVKALGCENSCSTPNYNHYDFLKKKLNREFGKKNNFSYCNLIMDTDMWILGGVVEILSANNKRSDLVAIAPEIKEKLLEYIDLGTQVVKSRMTDSNLVDFEGNPIRGLNFDLGSWDDHPIYKYSGYTGKDFPTNLAPNRANNVGWDISHFSAFVYTFDSLYKNINITGQSFPDREVMKKLSNQLIYGAFNRDFEKPLFSNYMDGTNGWYQVKTESGHGYAPNDLSISVITGGYGFWSEYNPAMKRVTSALWEMIKSDDPEIIKHRENHYGPLYRKFVRTDPTDFNYQDSLALLQFIPSIMDCKKYCSGTVISKKGIKFEQGGNYQLNDSSDIACCNQETDCVHDGACFQIATCEDADLDGDKDYCGSKNRWFEVDSYGKGLANYPSAYDQLCNACVGQNRWNLGGDAVSPKDDPNGWDHCCGDDPNEFLIGDESSERCSGAPVITRCCNSPTDKIDSSGNCSASCPTPTPTANPTPTPNPANEPPTLLYLRSWGYGRNQELLDDGECMYRGEKVRFYMKYDDDKTATKDLRYKYETGAVPSCANGNPRDSGQELTLSPQTVGNTLPR